MRRGCLRQPTQRTFYVLPMAIAVIEHKRPTCGMHDDDDPAPKSLMQEARVAAASAQQSHLRKMAVLLAATLGLAAATDEPIHVFNPSTLPVRTRSHTVSPA